MDLVIDLQMYNYSKILNSLVFKITFSFTIVVIGFMLALGFYVRHVALIESQNLQKQFSNLTTKWSNRTLKNPDSEACR